MRPWSFLRHKTLFSCAFQQGLPLCFYFLGSESVFSDIIAGSLLAKIFVGVIDTKRDWVWNKFLKIWLLDTMIRLNFKVLMVFIVFEDVFAFDEEEIGPGEIDLISLPIGVLCSVYRILRIHSI